jgi:hypothetical protein
LDFGSLKKSIITKRIREGKKRKRKDKEKTYVEIFQDMVRICILKITKE